MKRARSLAVLALEPLLIIGALAFLAAFISVYSIPSGSMAPTLQVGDHILVTSYGLPLAGHTPQRGDVIVFRAPASGEVLVKRVVAAPGDLVDAYGGNIRIGGHALAEPYLMQHAMSGAINAQIVPAESYFVMGDNRAHSYDSRSWGTVPRGSIIGKVRIVLWSSSDSAPLPNASASTNDSSAASATQHRRRFLVPVD